MHGECVFERFARTGYVVGGLLRVNIGLYWATCVVADDEGVVRHCEALLTGRRNIRPLLLRAMPQVVTCARIRRRTQPTHS